MGSHKKVQESKSGYARVRWYRTDLHLSVRVREQEWQGCDTTGMTNEIHSLETTLLLAGKAKVPVSRSSAAANLSAKL